MAETWLFKYKRTFIILVFIEGLFVAIFLASYIYYSQIRVEPVLAEQLVKRLTAAVLHNDSFHMADVTPFDWDVMYMFPPYTSRKKMEQEVGVPWTEKTSYWQFFLERTNTVETPMLFENVHKLVFVENGKVVCAVTLERAIDFTHIPQITEKSQAAFVVEQASDQRMIVTWQPHVETID